MAVPLQPRAEPDPRGERGPAPQGHGITDAGPEGQTPKRNMSTALPRERSTHTRGANYPHLTRIHVQRPTSPFPSTTINS
eukprot:2158051-Alexandrium_andersonii.AAC.1